MPTGNKTDYQIFYEVDGERKPLEIGAIEDCEQIVKDMESATHIPDFSRAAR